MPSHATQARFDHHFMSLALRLATLGRGLTLPNPMVGAVLVKNGKVIGHGYHQKAGLPHAEVNAVANAKQRGHSPEGATLYVTLEPCSTHGRTPPCTDLIVASKIRRVVYAATDPNPHHVGHACLLLRHQGIDVSHGLLATESMALNRPFNHFITTGRPYIIAKVALSLDGRITAPPADSRWLTSPQSLRRAHLLRWCSDAILVGAQTARDDNPKLTIRLAERPHPGAPKIAKEQPYRIVMTRSADKIPRDLHLFSDEYRSRTLLFENQSLEKILPQLGAMKISSLLIEGGARVLTEAFRCNLVNEVAFFVAPAFMRTSKRTLLPLPSGLKMLCRSVTRIGADLFFRALL